jgi:endonuclease/exonuclease/phosphatase (EEP) superfamily protein YafD
MKHWLTQGLTNGLGMLVVVVTLLTLTGYLGSAYYLFDLTAHFKLQYLIITLIALVWLSIVRNQAFILLSLVCIGLNLSSIVPWYLPQSQPAIQREQPLRALTANVLVENTNYEPTIELIRQEQPDIVAIIESSFDWIKAMRSVEDILPYSVESPRARAFGIVLYSKYPLTLESVETFDAPKDYHLVATVTINDRPVKVIALHPPPPRDKELFDHRNRELIEIGRYIRSLNQPAIALGDLNITMWSPNYWRFASRSQLLNTRQGLGILPSWPAYFPALLIPIDHVLVNSNVQVINTRIGRKIGSDHLPVIADLAY